MKKQYMIATLALSAAVLLAGCSWSDVKSKIVGGDSASKSAVSGVVVVEDYDANQCVTLAQYKGVEVDCSVTDEEYEKKVQEELQTNGKTKKVKKGKVEKWDSVTLDFTGKMDGKEFEGGSAEDATITVGMGQYIEDLENGIIGMEIGEEKDIDVTFPEDYNNANLAGKPAVFTVKVKSATRIKTKFDDAYVKKNTQYKTVADYEEGTKTELAQSKKDSAGTTAFQKVIDESTYNKIPETLLEAQKQQMDHYYRYSISSYYGDEDFETVLGSMGMTKESYESELNSSALSNAKIILVVEAIAAKENIVVDESEISSYINSNVSSAGTTFDAYREQYETYYGTAIPFEDFSKTSYLYEKVLDVIQDSVVIK